MFNVRNLVICICLASFLTVGLYGQTVAPVADPTRELKRTAHQLRITVDRLKNARQALSEATELARHSSDLQSFSSISQNWVRINKTKAADALEDLYGWLKTTARDAQDIPTYQRCRSSAQMLLRSIATLDSDRAVSLWRTWPDPPAALGPAVANLREQSAAEFEQQLAAGVSGPGMGMNLAAMSQQAAKGDYNAAGMMVMQLNQSGNHAEALRVADQTIASFRQGTPDPRSISGYLGFVRNLPDVDPERYMNALSSLMPSLNNPSIQGAGGTLTVGNQTVQLTAADGAVIELCRALNGRPDLAMRTLGVVPGLKAKLDGVGGIDTIVGPSGPNSASRPQISMSYSIDGQRKTTFSAIGGGTSTFTGPMNMPAPPGSTMQSAGLLFQTLRGKLAKDPALVQQKLGELARNPDQIDSLINLANYASSIDPDLASLALDYASRLIMQVEPLTKRATTMQSLIQGYQRCNGEADGNLLQQAMVVVQQLRDEESSRPAVMPSARGPVGVTRYSPADQLEAAVIGELALDNFNGAMKYIRLMPDDQKVQALLRVVQTLIQPY